MKKIQDAGLEVKGGFIVGFDNDHPKIFEELTNFIQQSGIVTAMVGLLNGPKGTKLEKRLQNEGRMLKDFTGNNTDFTINFIPKMDSEKLIDYWKLFLWMLFRKPQLFSLAILFVIYGFHFKKISNGFY